MSIATRTPDDVRLKDSDADRSAARLVRTGRVLDLAHVLHADVPAFPGRTFT